ncbi:MAG: hypothetical protein IPP88_25410 [Betaproteobacteria bacterium]|nr:hypothetical protein [Betaproteobacteria bacterium]
MKKSMFLASSVSGVLALLAAGAPAASVSVYSPATAIAAEQFALNGPTKLRAACFRTIGSPGC